MSRTSRIVEFWPKVEEIYRQNYYEDIKTSFNLTISLISIDGIRRDDADSIRVRLKEVFEQADRAIQGIDKNFLGFVGGGEQAVLEVNRGVGFEVPLEFANYLRYYCPAKDLAVSDLYEGTGLHSYEYIATYRAQDEYGFDTYTGDDTHEFIEGNFIVIGGDGPIGLAIDTDDENCPLYFNDAASNREQLQLAAPSLAHGLYLLGYYYLVKKEYCNYDYEWNEVGKPSPIWQKGIDLFQAKLNELAPESSLEDWFIRY
ncbi:MAG: hypothetical protein AAF708_18025 [Deinococcota bacterium]